MMNLEDDEDPVSFDEAVNDLYRFYTLGDEEDDENAMPTCTTMKESLNNEELKQRILSVMSSLNVGMTAQNRTDGVNYALRCMESIYTDRPAILRLLSVLANYVANDPDSAVRCSLAETLPMVYMQLSDVSQRPQMLHYIDEWLVPLMAHMLVDSSHQVRKNTRSAISLLIDQRFLTQSQLQDTLLPFVLRSIGDLEAPSTSRVANSTDDARLDVFGLVLKLVYQAPLDREWVLNNVLAQFTRFCGDSSFHLRKVCAMELGELAAYFGSRDGVTEKVLVPYLVQLSGDDVWGVRKDAARSYADVSSHVTSHCRRTVLAPHFDRLFNDISRWVIAQAYQSLGSFIATFACSKRTGCVIDGDTVSYETPSDDVDVQCLARERKELAELGDPVLPKGINIPAIPEATFADMTFTTDNDEDQEMSRFGPLLSDDEDEEDIVIDNVACTSSTDSSVNSAMYWAATPTVDLNDDDLYTFGKKAVGKSLQLPKLDLTSVTATSASDLKSPMDDLDVADFLQRRLSSTTAEKGEEEKFSAATLPRKRGTALLKVKRRSSTGGRSSTSESTFEATTMYNPDPPTIEWVPLCLVRRFTSMIEPALATSVEAEIARHCAHSLPAVTVTIGRTKWVELLSDTYRSLAADRQWKVRLCVAQAMHQMAVIVGEEITIAHLLPVFVEFMRDLDEVRIGILEHLYDFVQHLPMKHRISLLVDMNRFMPLPETINRDYRFRLTFLEQIEHMCSLYDAEEIEKVFSGIALTLAVDRYSIIRKRSTVLIVEILRQCAQHETSDSQRTRLLTMDLVKTFAVSNGYWRRRQTFAYVCLALANSQRPFAMPRDMFDELMLPQLVRLATSDSIKCVRSAAIWAIEALLMGDPNDEQLLAALEQVAADDADRSCRLHANTVLGRDADAIVNGEDAERRATNPERGATAPPTPMYAEAQLAKGEEEVEAEEENKEELRDTAEEMTNDYSTTAGGRGYNEDIIALMSKIELQKHTGYGASTDELEEEDEEGLGDSCGMHWVSGATTAISTFSASALGEHIEVEEEEVTATAVLAEEVMAKSDAKDGTEVDHEVEPEVDPDVKVEGNGDVDNVKSSELTNGDGDEHEEAPPTDGVDIPIVHKSVGGKSGKKGKKKNKN